MSALAPQLTAKAREVLDACAQSGGKVATAESCTGGLVAAALTDIAGSSACVDRGFVTYSNEAKTDMLGVPADLIAQHGAVSEPVARAMAEGALARSLATVTVAITGIAGPGGGSLEKPVGLVHFAAARRDAPTLHWQRQLDGGRDQVRTQAALAALDYLRSRLQERD